MDVKERKTEGEILLQKEEDAKNRHLENISVSVLFLTFTLLQMSTLMSKFFCDILWTQQEFLEWIFTAVIFNYRPLCPYFHKKQLLKNSMRFYQL